MVTDGQILRLRQALRLGMTLQMAALKAGIDRKTARRYDRLGLLPSEVPRMDRDWRTREDPFAEVWPQLEELLAANPGLLAKTLFAELQRRYPGRFPDGQLRSLQRRVKCWRALHGPAREVFFAQQHYPGRLAASDFTHCTSLRVTINSVPFAHLIYHFVLAYSNWETGTICLAESLESLSEGLQNALWQLGGVPALHRTDRLTAAIPPGTQGQAFTRRYQELLSHYGLQGQAIQAGQGHENGDCEQSHHRFKSALDQALMLRGSRDFASESDYGLFLRELFAQLNAGRCARLAQEMPLLRALPAARLEACKRRRVRVDKGSLIHLESNSYSVPSRLIGEWVETRLFADRVEVWYAQQMVEQLPRLRGKGKHRVDYRHVIDTLVRKPGAFADYRYRSDLFPSSRFRQCYDALCQQQPRRAVKEYLQILRLAARQSEAGVQAVLARLLDEGQTPSAAVVEEGLLMGEKLPAEQVQVGPVDLSLYDGLLEGKEATDGDDGREGDVGGLPQGTAPAGIPAGLRGDGPTGAAGVFEL